MKFKFEFTPDSLNDALEEVIGIHPTELEQLLKLSIIDNRVRLALEKYNRLQAVLPSVQGQIAACAAHASAIDEEALKVLRSLKPITANMKLSVELCEAVHQLSELAKDIQVIA